MPLVVIVGERDNRDEERANEYLVAKVVQTVVFDGVWLW